MGALRAMARRTCIVPWRVLVGTVSMMAAGHSARAPVVSPDGKLLFVTNQDDSTISIVDTKNPSIISTIDVGDSPEGIDITPNGKHVYVTNWGDGSISVINTDNYKIEKTIKTGKGSRAFGQFINQ